MLLAVALAAIFIGITLVMADEKIARVTHATQGPEAGATMARMMGFLLLVGGGLAFLTWTR